MSVVEARAEPPPTPGFPEPVVQWGTQPGETCADIANALYGSPKYAHLLLRYNRISCGGALPSGLTLIAPAKVTTAAARLRSMHPDVRTRPPGGGWGAGAAGQPLAANHNVQTLDDGRADIEFTDRTRVFLAPHTLVVLFGTASQTKVTKSAPPPIIEVQEGEVQAGLSALRGAPVEVSVPGGGAVSAASRDTVIARKGERTTVAVFEGKAGVTSGGKRVEVPTHFGTRFVGAKPPDPPRPLPPAPVFGAGSSPALAVETEGVLRLSWEPVPRAASYRVEVAREADFGAPIVREEVAAAVTSFRGEKLPAGRYFLRVRAIDTDDYLGLAATRSVDLVTVAVSGGRLEGGRLVVQPSAGLSIRAPTGAQVALDEGAFGPIPAAMELPRRLPQRLRLRLGSDQALIELPIDEDRLRAQVQVLRLSDGRVRIRLLPENRTVDGVLASGKLAARVAQGGKTWTLGFERLPDEGSVAAFAFIDPRGGLAQIEVVDGGQVLGSFPYEPERAPPPPPPPPPQPPLVPMAPLWAADPDAAPFWRAPRAQAGVSVSTLATSGGAYRLDARASGSAGPFDLDAALRTRLRGRTDDGLAWLGARLPFFSEDEPIQAGALLHFSLPTSAAAAAPTLDPALTLGGSLGRVSWAVDGGARARLSSSSGRVATAEGQAFVVAGATVRFAPWMRGYLVVDGRLMASPPEGDRLRGGASAGFEAGGRWFVGGAVRAAPQDPAGSFTGQLTLGLRDSVL